MKIALLVALALITGGFVVFWGSCAWSRRRADPALPTPLLTALGFVTDFLDTLSIGSFATTTTAFRLARAVDDRVIPGTLNVGHALPTVVQAFIYISIVRVDTLTLAALIVAAVAGAWLGAGVVASWPRRKVQMGMGGALLVAATVMVLRQFEVVPPGQAIELRGLLLAIALAGNFLFGALMTLGVGLYGPCLVMVCLLGMSPDPAFPIMMGSCAFLMPIGSVRFIRAGSYDLRAALSLTLGGIPGVLLGAFVFDYVHQSLSLHVIFWLVIAVVVYAAATMLWSALRSPPAPSGEVADAVLLP